MPRPSVKFHPDAVAEAAAASRWYAETSPWAADAFVAELDRAILLIADAPARWPAGAHGTRRFLLRRFPYSVVYRLSRKAVQVVAVAHARRKPGYWKRRRVC